MRLGAETLAANAFKAEGAAILAAELAAEHLRESLEQRGETFVLSREALEVVAKRLAEMATIAREYHVGAAEASCVG